MSLILEALKKSEQQRQQKQAQQQQVRKRTLSLSSRPSGPWPIWLAVAGLSLSLLSGWWLYSQRSLLNQEPSPTAIIHPQASGSALSNPAQTNPPQSQESKVKPASIPREVVKDWAPLPRKATLPPTKKAANLLTSRSETSEPLPNVDERSQLQAIDKESPPPVATQLPDYLSLSNELRSRMPSLRMSLHFYTVDPARRLVRINNQLLHEGDWLNQDLTLVEITPTGAILNFLGKLFELSGGKP